MIAKLIPLIPAHRIYVEVFGGAAALLFAKKPSLIEVYNDINSDLVNFYRVLRDEEKFERFYKKVSLTLYSREEYYYCCDTWRECEDDVERAYRWFVVARMSFSGRLGKGWGYNITSCARNMSAAISTWLGCIEDLPRFHERVVRVQIENKDFRDILKTYDTPETFFYLDPPYIHDTRKSGGYEYEMSNDDHRELVEMLLDIKGVAMLSGYKHAIYEPLERSGWMREDFITACHAAGRTRYTWILGKGSALRTQKRIESVWIKLSDNMHKQLLLSV